VAALEALFTLDPQEAGLPLFCFTRSIFNPKNFLKRLSAGLTNLGVDPIGFLGHSFRKGAAQHAHDGGVLGSQIQKLGRWTSDAFQAYFTMSPAILYRLNHQFLTGTPLPFTPTATTTRPCGPAVTSILRTPRFWHGRCLGVTSGPCSSWRDWPLSGSNSGSIASFHATPVANIYAYDLPVAGGGFHPANNKVFYQHRVVCVEPYID
jgi:hypothetical protein